ncbi:hypothetical protein LguiA_025370 [Lonicera macranthoides]
MAFNSDDLYGIRMIDNFEDMQIYKLNFERFEKSAFEELRQECVELKKKLVEIEGKP